MEVVTLHVGQAGVAASPSLWQLYCIEHGLNIDGTMRDHSSNLRGSGFDSFFHDLGTRASPRAIFVDMDSSSIDNVLTGQGCHLFSRSNAVRGREDAGSNYAKARYSRDGKLTVSAALSKVRSMVEGMSSFQGFVVQHALGGGTGSGIVCSLLDKMYYAFPKKPIVQFSIYPSAEFSDSVLEPYNTILGTAATKANYKCCCLSSNGAMFKALEKNGVHAAPNYKDLNLLWNYAIGTLTSSCRHGGDLKLKLDDIITNLVPFPNLRFPFISYSPIKSSEYNYSVEEIVKSCYQRRSSFLTCDVNKGRYLATTVLLQGDVSPKDVSKSLGSLSSSDYVRFAPWCPNGYKVGLCNRPSGTIPNSITIPGRVTACALNANTSVGQVWSHLRKDFRVMQNKKAFYHWYLAEGMEEDEFITAENEISNIIDSYTCATF